MKNKETLEEVAKVYAEPYRCPATNDNEYCKHDIISAFNNGAKWQQERSYSEEELKSAFKIGFNIGYGSPVQELDLKNEHCEKWFKQFKNK
jgi:hypothetical protein